MKSAFREEFIEQGRSGVLALHSLSEAADLEGLVQSNREAIDAKLLEHGALLFRGFNVKDVGEFDRVVNAVSDRRLDYLYRSTPRTKLQNRIFTATEFPASMEIPLHCENAYQREWPLKLAFCCIIPAESGGETPVADIRLVTKVIGETALDEFRERGVRYIRHYRKHTDIPWQTVFQTDSRDDLAKFCAQNGIEHEWIGADILRTVQVCQGVAQHPATNEEVFFNQAHLFHVSSVGEAAAKSLVNVFGADRVPRHACFGDGREIPIKVVESIRSAFSAQSINVSWRSGDVLLVDNMRFAHGRRSFKGQRRVLAALLDPHSQGLR